MKNTIFNLKTNLGAVLFLSSFSSFAQGNLKIPMAFENPNVLPAKIRNVRLRQGQFDARDKFDGKGQVVHLGNSLNKTVKFSDFIKAQDTEFEKGKLAGALAAGGYNEADVAGSTRGEVQIDVDATIPIIAYGVNSKLTTAIAIPIVKTKVDIKTGFVASDNLQTFTQKNLIERGSISKAYDLENKTSNAISRKLDKNKYSDDLENREQTRLGDIVFVNKYNLLKDENQVFSLRSDLTLPTGEVADHNRAVDIGAGDGQWDVGFAATHTYNISKNLSINTHLGYTFQIRDEFKKRIPEESDSKVTRAVDTKTKVDLGDIAQQQIYLKYSFGQTPFTVFSGFNFSQKYEDRHTGTKYSKYRYEYLNADTDQSMEVFLTGITFSTINMFRRGEFKVPLELSLVNSNVYNGKNVIKDNLTAFELGLFF